MITADNVNVNYSTASHHGEIQDISPKFNSGA